MLDLDLTVDPLKEKPICKGQIYKGKINCYVNKAGHYVYSETMVPAKRKSCKGCEECGWLDEILSEYIGNEMFPIINNIEHEKFYILTVTNLSRDWETNHVDDFDLEFIKIDA